MRVPMIYPDTFERKTGFDAVRAQVCKLCTSEPGVEHASAMSFSSDYAEVRQRLGETAEMARILGGDSDFPTGGIHDRRAVLMSLRVPGT